MWIPLSPPAPRRFSFTALLAAIAILVVPACASAGSTSAPAQLAAPPRALVVVAHPDDEIAMACTAYCMTQCMGGTVDQVIITNGEGGYKYSLLAEDHHGLPLTQEATGRKHLPAIRKQEALHSGRIIGTRKTIFFDQLDKEYTQDIRDPLKDWDTKAVGKRLDTILKEGDYDFLLTLLPEKGTHGHHLAATVLALEAAARMPAAQRPVVLGATLGSKGGPGLDPYAPLPDFPVTRLLPGAPTFTFDRSVAFGHRRALSYQVVANWVIAAHPSQGTLQMLATKNYELESFRVFDSSRPGAAQRAEVFFRNLASAAESGPPSWAERKGR